MSMPWGPSLDRNEPRGVGSTDPGPSVLDRLVADGEFSKVVPNHLWFDFNVAEVFTVVHCNYAAYHLWDNEHVADMSPDGLWLLTSRCIFFLCM